MEQLYLAYLALLGELSNSLDQLAGLAKQKNTAIRKDDLLALDQVLNQEQAMSLALRGQEQKRAKLLRELGLERGGVGTRVLIRSMAGFSLGMYQKGDRGSAAAGS